MRSFSDFAANPRLQDVNTGWIEYIRKQAAARVMKGVTLATRDMGNKVIAKGDYANPDALVQDARSSLLDEWYKDAPIWLYCYHATSLTRCVCRLLTP
ncbi:Phage major capsid protein [Salmonella bongori N268-08]|uniref:Phage major capsid protein n=1 Tax=Salmonella bongori N268-08 TaxID=1197719 RepID=S5MP85_SALBN|nr:Phage major capsid protein [Salmonella bongori N268-08]